MEKKAPLESHDDESITLVPKSIEESDLGILDEKDSGRITEKDKMSMAKQILLFVFLSFLFLVGASFIPFHHDSQLLQFAQQILPVATLIIGCYFNK